HKTPPALIEATLSRNLRCREPSLAVSRSASAVPCPDRSYPASKHRRRSDRLPPGVRQTNATRPRRHWQPEWSVLAAPEQSITEYTPLARRRQEESWPALQPYPNVGLRPQRLLLAPTGPVLPERRR